MIGFLQTGLFYIVPYAIVLGVVVTVHELGHFLAAKALGTKIDQFSIGFGRPIVRWTDRSGVEWRVGWAPFGGFVRFAGDENAASVPDLDDLAVLRRDLVARDGEAALNQYYHFKPVWQRAIIAAAGPFANFGLAIVLFAGLFMAFGELVLPARIASVSPGSAAAEAGLRSGDLFLRAAGHRIASFDDLTQIVRLRADVPTEFVVKRGSSEISVTATPHRAIDNDPISGVQQVGRLGVTPRQEATDFVRLRYDPAQALGHAVTRTWSILSTTVYYLGRLVTGQVSFDGLSGPLGIAAVTGKVAQLGAVGAQSPGAMALGVGVNLLQVMCLISISLGFMNLLPIPMLDGGHLLFYAYEAVARRPLAAKVQAAGYRVGLALVLGLMLFATWNDLQRLHVFNFIGRLI
jgi:regulator of sigma E protease